MNILLTNDDGISSELLKGLYHSLKFLGHNATIVAPSSNKSAVSHSVTLHKPISVTKVDNDIYSVDGTPVDCVYLSVYAVLKKKPDLLISGINFGPNFGDDVIYSGTVAAAREGYMRGIKSIAVSLLSGNNASYSSVIQTITPILTELSNYPLDSYFFNINIPNIADLTPQYHFTHLSKRKWEDEVSFLTKDHDIQYYAIGGSESQNATPVGSDADILKKGKISVTPITDNYTDFGFLKKVIK